MQLLAVLGQTKVVLLLEQSFFASPGETNRHRNRRPPSRRHPDDVETQSWYAARLASVDQLATTSARRPRHVTPAATATTLPGTICETWARRRRCRRPAPTQAGDQRHPSLRSVGCHAGSATAHRRRPAILVLAAAARTASGPLGHAASPGRDREARVPNGSNFSEGERSSNRPSPANTTAL
jgi:hypothetical protein